MWKNINLFVAFCGLLIVQIEANDNLKIAFQWKIMDFEYPSQQARQEAISSKSFVAENVIPIGLEVYKNRLFVTLPRWKAGVPATLTYIDLDMNGMLVMFY